MEVERIILIVIVAEKNFQFKETNIINKTHFGNLKHNCIKL